MDSLSCNTHMDCNDFDGCEADIQPCCIAGQCRCNAASCDVTPSYQSCSADAECPTAMCATGEVICLNGLCQCADYKEKKRAKATANFKASTAGDWIEAMDAIFPEIECPFAWTKMPLMEHKKCYNGHSKANPEESVFTRYTNSVAIRLMPSTGNMPDGEADKIDTLQPFGGESDDTSNLMAAVDYTSNACTYLPEFPASENKGGLRCAEGFHPEAVTGCIASPDKNMSVKLWKCVPGAVVCPGCFKQRDPSDKNPTFLDESTCEEYCGKCPRGPNGSECSGNGSCSVENGVSICKCNTGWVGNTCQARGSIGTCSCSSSDCADWSKASREFRHGMRTFPSCYSCKCVSK